MVVPVSVGRPYKSIQRVLENASDLDRIGRFHLTAVKVELFRIFADFGGRGSVGQEMAGLGSVSRRKVPQKFCVIVAKSSPTRLPSSLLQS